MSPILRKYKGTLQSKGQKYLSGRTSKNHKRHLHRSSIPDSEPERRSRNMVTTRQSARNAQQNGDTVPEEVEEDTEPQPTHTTSLTPKELRLIHQLCNFHSRNRHISLDPELKRHLYRFVYFMPPPYKLRSPSAWGHANWRDPPDAPLPTAVAKAHALLSRPGSLTPIPAPLKPPAPPALLQRHSPLFSVIPAEIRTQIFELVLTLPTRNGKAQIS